MNYLEKIRNIFIHQMQIIMDGEENISQALPALMKKTESGKIFDFLASVSKSQNKILAYLNKTFTLLNVNKSKYTDSVIQTLLSEESQTLKNYCVAHASAETAISIYYHTIAAYQVEMYETAVDCAAELGNANIFDLISECLKEKKIINNKIRILEESFNRQANKNFELDENLIYS